LVAATGEKPYGKDACKIARLCAAARDCVARSCAALQRGCPPADLAPSEAHCCGRAKLAVVLALGGALVAWWWRRKTRAHPQRRVQYQSENGEFNIIIIW